MAQNPSAPGSGCQCTGSLARSHLELAVGLAVGEGSRRQQIDVDHRAEPAARAWSRRCSTRTGPGRLAFGAGGGADGGVTAHDIVPADSFVGQGDQHRRDAKLPMACAGGSRGWSRPPTPLHPKPGRDEPAPPEDADAYRGLVGRNADHDRGPCGITMWRSNQRHGRSHASSYVPRRRWALHHG